VIYVEDGDKRFCAASRNEEIFPHSVDGCKMSAYIQIPGGATSRSNIPPAAKSRRYEFCTEYHSG
jgi:hypothetical protein